MIAAAVVVAVLAWLLIASVTRRWTGDIVASCWQISLAERSIAVLGGGAEGGVEQRPAELVERGPDLGRVLRPPADARRARRAASGSPCPGLISSLKASTIGQGEVDQGGGLERVHQR